MADNSESQCWLGVCVSNKSRGEGWGWREAAAEGVGTALLVLLCCLAGAGADQAAGAGSDQAPGAGVGADPAVAAVARALTAGAVVAALVQSFDQMSGAQLNPAVTLAKWLGGHVGWRAGLTQVAAQLVGATLAGATLAAAALSAPHACTTRPHRSLSALQAMGVEALLTSVLSLANLASWRAALREAHSWPLRVGAVVAALTLAAVRTHAHTHSWPLRVGAVVAALTLAAGELTGASMNPARSVGPALCAQDYTHLWVYVAGPAAGAGVGAALHHGLRPRPRPPPPNLQLDPATLATCKRTLQTQRSPQ